MSQLHLSDEILMAFADGELDEPVAAAVAKAMSENPDVAKQIMSFQRSRQLTRSAFSPSLMPDVPLELQAAVSAQVKAYETAGRLEAAVEPIQLQSIRPVQRPPLMQMALAASVAAIALALGYFAGRQGSVGTGGPITQLESSVVRHELSKRASGEDVKLPFGHLRVISTYRLANGSLCREFRLQSSVRSTEAVACRNGEWNVSFAAAKASNNDEYTPSSGDNPMTAYLQTIGAGQPLVGEVEAKALTEAAR